VAVIRLLLDCKRVVVNDHTLDVLMLSKSTEVCDCRLTLLDALRMTDIEGLMHGRSNSWKV